MPGLSGGGRIRRPANEQWKEFVLRKMSGKVDASTLEAELEDTIADIDSQIGGAYEKQITAKQLYKILANFDKLYYRLTDLEKKEFLRDFIESVEIYPEKMDNGRICKQINFNFPVYYDGEVGKEIRLLNENTVESIVLLSKLHAKQNIEVGLTMSELDLTAVESKATYEEIKAYVIGKYRIEGK